MGDTEDTPEFVDLELVIHVRYSADPAQYETDDPEEMAEIDFVNFSEDPDALLEMISNPAVEDDVTIQVIVPDA
jgi:hypothetical protein